MHVSIILLAIGLAMLLRLWWSRSNEAWTSRWQQALGAFLVSPMLLLTTSMTVLSMGHHGTMLGLPVGWIGCCIALLFLSFAGGWLCYLTAQVWRSLQSLKTLPITTIAGRPARVLKTSELFAAQIGVWRSELVISQGLLQTLEPEQLKAVLSHEQAHYFYRDTFWFFWLGWIRQVTSWLPRTEALWQELLLLRELRADRWATQRVDALVLAESLLMVVRSPLIHTHAHYAAFHDVMPPNRLEERIDSILNQPELNGDTKWRSWLWLPLSLLPLLTLPLHC